MKFCLVVLENVAILFKVIWPVTKSSEIKQRKTTLNLQTRNKNYFKNSISEFNSNLGYTENKVLSESEIIQTKMVNASGITQNYTHISVLSLE